MRVSSRLAKNLSSNKHGYSNIRDNMEEKSPKELYRVFRLICSEIVFRWKCNRRCVGFVLIGSKCVFTTQSISFRNKGVISFVIHEVRHHFEFLSGAKFCCRCPLHTIECFFFTNSFYEVCYSATAEKNVCRHIFQ